MAPAIVVVSTAKRTQASVGARPRESTAIPTMPFFCLAGYRFAYQEDQKGPVYQWTGIAVLCNRQICSGGVMLRTYLRQAKNHVAQREAEVQ
jgi:hypothetical protein